jgi:hypothetical protein
MNINSHKFKRFFQKIGIYLTKKLNTVGKEKLNDNELEASILFRKLLEDSSTDLLTSPLSGKYYLKSTKRKMLFILNKHSLFIINNSHGYTVYISNFLYEKMRNIFVEEIEKRRIDMEKEFSINIKHSLKNIIKELKK